MNSDAVTQALLSHANTPCKTLKVSPAQLAFGRTLRDFLPRNVESLLPVPGNFLTAEAKEQRQRAIRTDMGSRLDLHTKVLSELNVGDHVQLQNLRGAHPLKLDRSGVVISNDGFSSYTVKVSGSGLLTRRNRATLRKIFPTAQSENLLFGQGQKARDRETESQGARDPHGRTAGPQSCTGGWS